MLANLAAAPQPAAATAPAGPGATAAGAAPYAAPPQPSAQGYVPPPSAPPPEPLAFPSPSLWAVPTGTTHTVPQSLLAPASGVPNPSPPASPARRGVREEDHRDKGGKVLRPYAYEVRHRESPPGTPPKTDPPETPRRGFRFVPKQDMLFKI